jgi:polyisoprenoid-binding protein YceI
MKLKLILAALLASLAALATPAAADTYDFDIKGQHAFIDFRIKHLGYSWLLGRFDKFNGSFDFDEKNADASKVKVEIDMASINSNHAERDKHLRGPDFLDVAKFPTATFESTSVKGDGTKAAITGKLTLHGVTKDVTINAERVGGGPDPWTKGSLRQGFTGTAKITLADFGITKDLGPASKDVELTLNVEGTKKP